MNDADKSKYFPQTKNDPQLVRQVFGPQSSAALAQRIKQENPQLFRELKSDALVLGLVASLERPRTQLEKAFEKSMSTSRQRTFSDQEIEARARFSEQDCRRLFVERDNTDAAASLKKSDAQAYATAKLAAQSYGILSRPEDAPERPAATGDELATVSDDLADRANLPRGLKVNVAQLDHIVKTVAQIEIAKRGESKPVQPVETRTLGEASVAIGREKAAA